MNMNLKYFLVCLLLAIVSTQAFGGQKRALYVAYPEAVAFETSENKNISQKLYHKMTTYLTRANDYFLVGMDKSKAMEEVTVYNESCTSLEECAINEGKRLSAEVVLISRIIKDKEQFLIVIELQDLLSGKLMNKVSKEIILLSQLDRTFTRLLYTLFKNKEKSVSGGIKKKVIFKPDPPGAIIFVDDIQFKGITLHVFLDIRNLQRCINVYKKIC